MGNFTSRFDGIFNKTFIIGITKIGDIDKIKYSLNYKNHSIEYLVLLSFQYNIGYQISFLTML